MILIFVYSLIRNYLHMDLLLSGEFNNYARHLKKMICRTYNQLKIIRSADLHTGYHVLMNNHRRANLRSFIPRFLLLQRLGCCFLSRSMSMAASSLFVIQTLKLYPKLEKQRNYDCFCYKVGRAAMGTRVKYSGLFKTPTRLFLKSRFTGYPIVISVCSG